VNNGKAETARAFKIERAIVDEDTFFGWRWVTARRDTKMPSQVCESDVARAEENLETFAKG